jgi:hypothetical protein
VGCLLFICLFFPGTGICQSSSSSQPSGLAIRQKILALRQARLERELNVVSRCLKQAQLQLRDINGNINRVASTDLINCGRQLRQVQRKLASLGREAAALSRRAEAQAFLLESLIQRRAALARISAASGR